MKLLLCTNSKNTTPITFSSATNFKAVFNRVIKLPAYCQICVLSAVSTDAQQPKLHYVNITNLPVQSLSGNSEKGNTTTKIGYITSSNGKGNENKLKNFIDLNNTTEMVITDLDILLTNEDNEESSGFSSSTEILLGYRQDPARRGTTEYFK
jgi:hypothetical protein